MRRIAESAKSGAPPTVQRVAGWAFTPLRNRGGEAVSAVMKHVEEICRGGAQGARAPFEMAGSNPVAPMTAAMPMVNRSVMPGIGATPALHIAGLYPDTPIFLPEFGRVAQPTGKDMRSFKANFCGHVRGCEGRTLENWMAEISSPKTLFFRHRSEFLSDVGYAVLKMRRAKGWSRTELARAAETTRLTILDIEANRHLEGSRLSKLATVMAPMKGRLHFALRPEGQPEAEPERLTFAWNTSAVTFAAGLTRMMRDWAGLTQAELGFRIQVPKALRTKKQSVEAIMARSAPASSPMISRIEKGQGDASIRTGTLFNIAAACDMTIAVDLDWAGQC